MRHHSIVVSSWNAVLIKEAYVKAEEIFPWVSPISPGTTNGYHSFFIPPDGSKEGWDESVKGDKQRDAFIDWLNGYAYEDGSSPFGWVEVQFDDDDLITKVIRDSDDVYRG